MLYGPTVFFAKFTLLMLYHRIFSPDRWTRLFIYFGIGVIFIVYTVTASIFVGLCVPRKGESWALALLSSRCRVTIVMAYVQGIFNIVSDFYVLVLPLPVLWKLQLPLRKKVGVSAVFMTGFLLVTSQSNSSRLCIITHSSFIKGMRSKFAGLLLSHQALKGLGLDATSNRSW